MLQPCDLFGGPKTTKQSSETKLSPRVVCDHVIFLAVLRCFFFFFLNSSLVHTLFPSTGKVFSVYLFSLIGLVLTTLHREAGFFTHQFQVKPLFVQRWLPRQSFNWFVSFPHSHCRVGRKLCQHHGMDIPQWPSVMVSVWSWVTGITCDLWSHSILQLFCCVCIVTPSHCCVTVLSQNHVQHQTPSNK